jgi:hypothetical protein
MSLWDRFKAWLIPKQRPAKEPIKTVPAARKKPLAPAKTNPNGPSKPGLVAKTGVVTVHPPGRNERPPTPIPLATNRDTAERYAEKMDSRFQAHAARRGFTESESGRRRRIDRIASQMTELSRSGWRGPQGELSSEFIWNASPDEIAGQAYEGNRAVARGVDDEREGLFYH